MGFKRRLFLLPLLIMLVWGSSLSRGLLPLGKTWDSPSSPPLPRAGQACTQCSLLPSKGRVLHRPRPLGTPGGSRLHLLRSPCPGAAVPPPPAPTAAKFWALRVPAAREPTPRGKQTLSPGLRAGPGQGVGGTRCKGGWMQFPQPPTPQTRPPDPFGALGGGCAQGGRGGYGCGEGRGAQGAGHGRTRWLCRQRRERLRNTDRSAPLRSISSL